MSGRNRLTKTVPPPSPIPTGRGSRSASNEPFDQFLDGSLHVPALSLPETSAIRRSVPAEIDLQSLVSGDEDSVDRIVRSAKNFGVFRIVGHGISVADLRSLIGGGERVLGQSERESAGEVRRVFRERILWIGSGIESLESVRRFVGDIERYRDLR
ncbi:hypothetical protein L484_021959 [Morus notabilis]|uniref:Non-haem dioxygenase N-terminal domain-containing protein n=1 Tax=Morus notabilis TaxID=981085 RepID=W9R909_9ROSA|nr:uncharacterized protein LOC21404796 [Morus notabilis]EXB42367.1 hypothetical protein L484_021959 [Morus notabilis]